jgi:hypothetical protein
VKDGSSGTEPSDAQVPTGVALFGLPEYDTAFVDFMLKVRDGLIAAMYPPLGKVQRVKTRTLFRGQNSIGAGEPVVQPVIATKTPLGVSQTSVHNTDIESLTGELVAFAELYGKSLIPQVVASINSVTTATGNIVNAGGSLTIDTYLEMLDTVDIPFDPQGEPSLPSLVTQDLQEVELSALGEFTAEQETRKAQIIARKREEHLARRRSRRIPENSLGT